MAKIIPLDLSKKRMGRAPNVRQLIWANHPKKGEMFLVHDLEDDDGCKATLCKELLGINDAGETYLDPYNFYLMRSKYNNHHPNWQLLVIDNGVLYSCLYWEIMTDTAKTFKELYDKTLDKEMTAFEVMSFFGL